MKFLKFTGLAISFILLMAACDSNPSLQKFYVDSKENSEFISIDLPSSILQLKDTEISEDLKSTLETIKKVNFIALQLNETNKDLYTSEKKKVKKILNNSKYKQLMRMNIGSSNVIVSYLGAEDAIDEVIIFGSDNDKGFAVVRVIGKNMNPSAILKLAQKLKIDGDSNELKQLGSILSSIK